MVGRHHDAGGGAKVCEYLRLDAQGKIMQGSANHPTQHA
jgi:hypothetical protein